MCVDSVCLRFGDICSLVVLQTLNFLRSLPERHGKPLSKVIPDANLKGMYRPYGRTDGYTNMVALYSATSLLETLLQFDPELRLSAADALASPYLAPYHDPSDEPEATEVFEESFQEADLSADLWKTITYV